MAGISFELRKILKENTLGSILKAFGYSVVLMAGPYIISILTLILAFVFLRPFISDKVIIQFGIVVTYLTAFTLVITGFSQLMITRFLADRLFEGKEEIILPNLMGNMLLNMSAAFILSLLFSLYFFKDLGVPFIIAFTGTFSIMSGIWIINIVIVGFKSYKFIVFSFLLGYLVFFLSSFLTVKYNLTGLLVSFFLGQGVIYFLLLSYFVRSYPSKNLIAFDFLEKDKIYISLIFSGFFYNLGIWIDKFIFWFHRDTGLEILGPIRSSIVYDIPMFLAYLSITPGIAIFFLKLETEFAEYYNKYYKAVREGATLNKIYEFGDNLLYSARNVIFDTLRIQGIFFIVIIFFDKTIFKMFNLSFLYIPIFHILLLAVYMQLIFMMLLAILNYFDRRKEVLILSLVFVLLNGSFTYISIALGPYFYGYGFLTSLFICNIFAVLLLRRFLNEIHYQTFMLI